MPSSEPSVEPSVEQSALVVDVANVVGSRPDGWWRDRAGAATRLLAQLARLAAADGVAVHAVLEGRARSAVVPPGVRAVLAEADGDTAVAEVTAALVARAVPVTVVTADRGLRARLPAEAEVTGPGRLRDRLDALGADDAAKDGSG